MSPFFFLRLQNPESRQLVNTLANIVFIGKSYPDNDCVSAAAAYVRHRPPTAANVVSLRVLFP